MITEQELKDRCTPEFIKPIFIHHSFYEPNMQSAINELKEAGHIIKSELQQKVEEAEEMYGKWESCIKGFLDKDLGEYKIIEGFYNVIQLLKQSHPEFKK